MYDVAIIGSGPAGLTAAIYATRSDMKTVVIEGLTPGGQLMITSEVENFPGFPEGIEGPELMGRMRKQATKFGVEYLPGDLSDIDASGPPFKLTAGKNTVEAKSVIIATGSSARWLGMESETKLRGKGVSACATCDGFFFTGKEIAVVGGGDSALEEATFLTKFASKVSLIHRRDELRGTAAMQKKAKENKKVAIVWNSVIDEILGVEEDRLTGLRLKNVKTDELSVLPVEGLFIAIGHTPATKVFEGKIDLDKKGYIVVTDNTRTSVPGIFMAGDVGDPRYKQAISAAGLGCMAAIDALRFIDEE
ncbi:MAG: thioredoxin-disulfide reductase [Candidatus Krumholzibacteria bacterium]|nr:thioredoxin-disulfide reductase [Candidatus Krumholzibacteria bacterium]